MKLKVLELSKRSLELSVAVLFVMSIAVFGLPVSVSAFEDGDGTEETPYRIGDCQQLQDMQDDLDAYYVLANDIDCSETTEWNSGDGFVPVGDNANPFLGELDGDYHTISNLHINRDDWEVGLFGRVGQWDNQVGLVTKVGMEDVDITGDWSTGGIVGVLYGQVNTSYTTGEVNGSGETGGLVGSHGGVWDTVIDSWSSADVTGGELVGGLVGFSLIGCGTGGTATITVTFTGSFNPSSVVARKYNPNSNAFTTINGAVLEKTTLNSNEALQITYTITDGGELDMDGTVNGTIVDPVGLGSQAISAPNTGLNREQ